MMHGRIIYHGNIVNSILNFNDLGGHFKVPAGSNPVDHFMYTMQKKVPDTQEYTKVFLNSYETHTKDDVLMKIVESLKQVSLFRLDRLPSQLSLCILT